MSKIWAMLILPVSFVLWADPPQLSVPLPEHPRPDWCRRDWLNLNGNWRFEFDANDVGEREKWFESSDGRFSRTICVPFPWGSRLSGVKDEADVGWYRRDITVPAAWKGRRVFLVVGAADHDTACWFDGKRLGDHSGGYTPFEFELTDHIVWGRAQKLTLRAWDVPTKQLRYDWRLSGKQYYGNARGIWQTVYLEARGDEYIKSIRFTPDIKAGKVTADVRLGAPARQPLEFKLEFRPEDSDVPAIAAIAPGQMSTVLSIPFRDVKLWSPSSPYLYDVRARLSGNGSVDDVATYFGFREISVARLPGSGAPYVALNGKPLYLQMALDQSYHPDGFYTFPTDAFMKNEIQIAKDLGLTGIRIHIKTEIPRKLYWADRLGVLVMADVPCAWGMACEAMFREHRLCFEEMVDRDFNHPSIFSWVLFNETWGLFASGDNFGRNRAARYAPWVRRKVAESYARAKALDKTRLVEDNSPCNRDHVVTDLSTWHKYRPGFAWEETIEKICNETFPGSRANYIGGFVQGNEPMFNSECGNVWGYKGSTGDVDWSWDYHMMINAFRRRLKCAGWLYTEHHDVRCEWNGYVRFDRTAKFTGIEELFPESSLRDWHADAYLPLDAELCREFPADGVWRMPVDVSLTTERYAGRRLDVSYRIRAWDARGKLKESESAKAGSFTAASWQCGRILDVPVRLPDETACGTICFTLQDGTDVIARNFACFVTRQTQPLGVSVAPDAFVRASWSQRQWTACGGLKVNGTGDGFFEYAFSGLPVDRSAVFRAEVSTKRLNAKDVKGDGKSDDATAALMGEGYAARSMNPNSYPMTSTDKWPGKVKIYANGQLVKTVALPDDPADHRGLLSWFSQKRPEDGDVRKTTLDEAGSYGYLVEADIPSEMVARGNGRLVIRLESDGHGLAVYGARFGRYPFDPTVESGQ